MAINLSAAIQLLSARLGHPLSVRSTGGCWRRRRQPSRMSRARVHEVSSPISLFPFIGILLCTMGALLVVLVAVSRSRAIRPSRKRGAKSRRRRRSTRARRRRSTTFRATWASSPSIRGEAERKLREEHARLSHVEDHIRRLQEQDAVAAIGRRRNSKPWKRNTTTTASRPNAKRHGSINSSKNREQAIARAARTRRRKNPPRTR